ncbi:MAG: Fic family protein [Candidatus Symbiothrix sp.]|jgi:Fic family protein|nr:Fic family protein [Candidatus Symbiothrix sp.]
MDNDRINNILAFIKENPECSSREIFEALPLDAAYPTVKRDLAKLIAEGAIFSQGQGKASKYLLSNLFLPVNLDEYFQNEVDGRNAQERYNFSLIPNILSNVTLFKREEWIHLNNLQQQFIKNSSELSESAYRKEMERLAIDLSWKSSQIEGNTYSLLETERLLKEKETASGKSKEEAVMLLNHKDAIDFILENQDYLVPLTVSKIEDIHSILTKELNVERNIRTRRVGITGTNYRPIDNEFQIREELRNMCELVNARETVFEKALLSLVLISYIQPFNDGNKRTARIVSNAVLIAGGYCPLSFRTVNSIDYKKAMLLFYEQNNLSEFKKIFIDQFEFAVNTYF